jgi:hypothetical protein
MTGIEITPIIAANTVFSFNWESIPDAVSQSKPLIASRSISKGGKPTRVVSKAAEIGEGGSAALQR